MRLEHIKSLLQISCNFNTSTINHSFTIGEKDILAVKCIKNTFILEVTTSEHQHVKYYLSIDQAAEALYEKIQANKNKSN